MECVRIENMLNCAGTFPMLPGSMLQVESHLLNFYIAAQMGVSSAHAYFPHSVSDSQLRMVHSRTDTILLRACKSHPLLGFRGEVVKQCHCLIKVREVKVRDNKRSIPII